MLQSAPPAPTKGCAFCTQPADWLWVGGDEWDQVVVYCCSDHKIQARERWGERYARFQAALDFES
jgi:hypothetical protein